LPLAGAKIGDFILEEAIGIGGMGAVFRARDRQLDRPVALKILPPEQTHDPEVVQRFYQEGRAAGRLDHENIARVYSIGHDGAYHYIAFEFIEGTTIRHRVERQGPLTVAEAIHYTLQVAGALVHAAEREVVHRDVKPSNILLTPHGRAKLVDMGLARRFERGGDDGLTQSGMTLGTFDYISPEQARDPRDVDVRSDLYSLGCTLFYMLAGRAPFPEGTVLQKLIQHQEETPPDIRTLNPNVPPGLASILAKLMAKDRDRRYQAPEQLVRDLLGLSARLGLRSVSPDDSGWSPAVSRRSRWERHLVWVLPIAAFVFLFGGLLWWTQELSNEPWRAAPERNPGGSPRTNLIGPAVPPHVQARPKVPPADEAIPLRDIFVDSTEDLLPILAQAPPRAVVILADDGPYFLGGAPAGRPGPAALLDRDLTLRADVGARPVLRLARDAAARGDLPAALLDFVGGHVVLEGLEFVLESGDEEVPLASIRAQDTELTVRRCVFRRPGESGQGSTRQAALRVGARAFTDNGKRSPAVTVQFSHFDAGQVAVLADGPVGLSLSDCTIAALSEPALWCDNHQSPFAVPVDLQLDHVSILAGPGPIFMFERTTPRVRVDDSVVASARRASPEVELVATDDPTALDWVGQHNLYGNIGTFLDPTNPRYRRDAIRNFTAWVDADSDKRERNSVTTDQHAWSETNPSQALTPETLNPTTVFRLAARPSPTGSSPGARQGPFGTLNPPEKNLAGLDPRRELLRTDPTILPSRNGDNGPASAPEGAPGSADLSPMPGPMPIAPEAGSEPREDLPQASNRADRAVVPSSETEDTATRNVAGTSSTSARPAESLSQKGVPGGLPTSALQATSRLVDKPPGTPQEIAPVSQISPIARTAAQFLAQLRQPIDKGGTLQVAADANWAVSPFVVRLPAGASWVLKAEAGASRPRIRFHPAPVDPKDPTAWAVWMNVLTGNVRLEGIDLVLPLDEAPAQGRWAGFGIGSGAQLSLVDCTITVEGSSPVSAAVEVHEGIPAGNPPDAAKTDPAPAQVRLTDSLLRGGGDLFDISGDGRLVLELKNAVVAAAGSLVHAHGSPRARAGEPVRLDLDGVTARVAGGLVLLDSAPGEPELPVTDISARNSILATTATGMPLFRVDGQDDITSLRDRIRWQGHNVVYHQIDTYRRDQSALLGALPTLYNRSSWMVAVGAQDTAPTHADAKFELPWEPSRPLWGLRREDVRLNPDTPAPTAGANLDHIPSPPPAT
jgi:serine/threonine-protein kinase